MFSTAFFTDDRMRCEETDSLRVLTECMQSKPFASMDTHCFA